MGNAPAQDPVFQFRDIRAHLLRVLISSARCDLKAPAQNPAQQGQDCLRTVLQKREFGGVKADRGIACHLQGSQLSACQAYIEHGSQGVQVCPLPDPGESAHPDLRSCESLFYTVVDRVLLSYFIHRVNTVVVDQCHTLFLPLSDQQDIVRADVEVQIAGLMEGLQYIQRALQDPDRMQKQLRAAGTPVLPLRPAQLLIQIPPSGISHQTVQRVVIFICIDIDIHVRGNFFEQADMNFISPQKGHPVQFID